MVPNAAPPPPAVDELARSLAERGWTLAVAESLTCGRIVSTIGAGEGASDWLSGGVVAYRSEVKFDVLGVAEGPVITAACARQMAAGVARLLSTDVGLGVTGCGGPDPEEGQPPGTVYMAVVAPGCSDERHVRFTGDPTEVIEQTTAAAIDLIRLAIGQLS